ncbi:MAG: iron-containing alcohol dehydrogenase family protein [Candidatus Helarchaeota archaeon]
MENISFGKSFEFISPKIIFGIDKFNDIATITRDYGSNILLVTGRTAMRKYGVLDRAKKLIEDEGLSVHIFDKVEPEVSCETVDQGVKFCKDENCDCVLSIGGGSALDCGKAIAIMVNHEGETWEYQENKKLERPGLPFIAVPTTAGTGSEITKNAVLINKKNGWKASIRHPFMVAKVAVVDPKLTLTMPPKITASTGMDALTQAIESYVSLKSNALSDILAINAITLISKNLVNAVKDGENLVYREKMALGSLISALAFSNSGLGGVHGLAHPIGADFKIPHGEICAILLPILMEYNMNYNHSKYMTISKTMDPKAKSITDGINFIKKLNESIGIPNNLKHYNIDPEKLKQSINKARGGSFNANPRKIDKNEIYNLIISKLF